MNKKCFSADKLDQYISGCIAIVWSLKIKRYQLNVLSVCLATGRKINRRTAIKQLVAFQLSWAFSVHREKMAETPKRKKKQISIDSRSNRVELGVGSYGNVFKGKYKGRPVAVKRVLLHNYSQNEEEAMLKLDHPNIIKLLHCESDNDFRYYAMKLCVASLDKLFLQSDHPQKYNGPMPRHIEVFHQLASGLEHIHSKNLIHRDIKPENILISMQTAGQNEEITIKWADFGLSRTVNERGTFTMKSGIKGTKKWFAPEILRLLETGEEGRGDVRSDVFALALVFGCLFLDGQHLYGSALNKDELVKNIIEGKPVNMQKIDEKLRGLYENELLQKMLEDDPSKRMTSKQVVDQLKSIKEELARKEEELRQLCAGDIQLELAEKIKDLIRLGIDVNAKDKDGNIALDYLYKNRSRNPNQHVADAITILEAETVTRSTKRKGEEPHADANEHKKRG
ncbi:Serine/threonine-protein kinase SBK1 [Daphnia magna]|uniref:Serine/threonine-protein kinase SBK1 n=1 Tax=Daphnia magna TaxID=35525 RepID=A0A0P6BHV3_9CRUS|nr:Serine/threonine-protein kinase SBK1 [Daphnia magna]